MVASSSKSTCRSRVGDRRGADDLRRYIGLDCGSENSYEPEATELIELLDHDEVVLAAPVRVEILSGTRPRDYGNIRRVLSSLPMLIPTQVTWQRIDEWIERAVRANDRFGVADLLIAAIAAENDATLWSKDSDFARMAALGFVALHR